MQSFKFDWLLDEDANIDWFNILGQKNNKNTIIENVKITTLNTDGVISVDNIEILDKKNLLNDFYEKYPRLDFFKISK